MSFKRQRAYPVGDAPIPYSRATLYRWEAAGLITLVRVGGKTLITDDEIDRILSGQVPIPPHPRRLGHAQLQSEAQLKGRPRKPPTPVE